MVRLELNTIVESGLFLKASGPSVATVAPRVTEVIPPFTNARSPTVLTVSGIVIVVGLAQPENASQASEVTVMVSIPLVTVAGRTRSPEHTSKPLSSASVPVLLK